MSLFEIKPEELFARGERLNRYMQSVDDDLKNIAEVVNSNFANITLELRGIKKEIQKLKLESKVHKEMGKG